MRNYLITRFSLVSCLVLTLFIPFPSYSRAAQIRVIELQESRPFMGGELTSPRFHNNTEETGSKINKSVPDEYYERFLRPSQKPILKPKYKAYEEKNGSPMFNEPQEVVRAYFDYLFSAENMNGYYGGCGTIGEAKGPFPYAYRLLSEWYKQQWSYEQFFQSFAGIGHTNLIQLIPAPLQTVKTKNPTFLVEIETIQGTKKIGDGTVFKYYYGYVTTVREGETGWKIDKIEYHPEDFLCHAYHGWSHDGPIVISVKYGNWCKLVDPNTVGQVSKKDNLIEVDREGKDGTHYKFIFTRLANGFDEKIAQYRQKPDGEWEPWVFEAEDCLDKENRG